MFKLVTRPEFSHPVKVRIPVDGGFDETTFNGKFRVLPISEADQHNTLSAEGTMAYLREIFVGWDGVVDDQGDQVLFSDATRDRMLDVPFVRIALLETYNSAVMGAKRGN